MHRMAAVALITVLALSIGTMACTYFSYGNEDLVLFGNSEDHRQLPVLAWFVPASTDEYACLFVGYDTGFAQGGVNSAGLAFDAGALEAVRLNDHPELPTSDPINFCEVVLRQCATIEEAVAVIQSYNLSYANAAQFLFTDRTGKSLVVAPGMKRELEFITTDLPYQVMTNTNMAYYPHSHKDCPRHRAASAVLEEIYEGNAELSIETFELALEAVAVDHTSAETMYSNIFDLTHGKIHLYFQHNFERSAILSMDELCAENQYRVFDIAELFADTD